jgi:hypothetical protein
MFWCINGSTAGKGETPQGAYNDYRVKRNFVVNNARGGVDSLPSAAQCVFLDEASGKVEVAYREIPVMQVQSILMVVGS